MENSSLSDKFWTNVFTIGCIVLIYIYGYAPTNNTKKQLPIYLNEMKIIKVDIPDEYISGFTVNRKIYKKGFSLVGFRGLSGRIYNYSFYSASHKKYFRICMFNIDISLEVALDRTLKGRQALISVNRNDLKNSNYGTKENPIPVFKFKGAKETIGINASNPDGSAKLESIETTEEQYVYNVNTYLTYIMTSKEFKQRFEN